MATGKCPKCDKIPASMVAEPIDAHVPGGKTYKGVNYLCPYCRAILGSGLDPLALKADTIAGVVKKLGR